MTSPRFTIYCHTNRVNGKRYVGQTVCAMEKRWTDHVSVARSRSRRGCSVFYAAIRKYGADAFEHEVLETVTAQSEANLSEMKWIEQLQTRTPGGYNLKSGGGGLGRHHEESIRRMKEFWLKLTPKERSARVRHQLAGMSVAQRRAGALKAWANMSPEARETRILKTRAAAAGSDTIRSEKIRAAWANMSSETRATRVSKMRSASVESDMARSEKSRAWQTKQAKSRTPEQRREIVLKSWAVRRARYGGRGHTKPPGVIGDTSRITWAGKTPEALADHGRKIREGHRRTRETKNARLVRINFLRAA